MRLRWAAGSRASDLKLAAFGVKIGYPEKWLDYGAVKIARDDYIGNVLRADAFEVGRRLARIRSEARGVWCEDRLSREVARLRRGENRARRLHRQRPACGCV